MEETRTQEVSTQTTVSEPVFVEQHPQKAYAKKKAIFRIYQIIWYIYGIILTLLAFRVVFKALGANPNSGFVSLIYALSDPLALPFAGIFRTTVAQGSVFEWSTLIAALVYLLLAYGLVKLLQLIKPASPQEVEQIVNRQ